MNPGELDKRVTIQHATVTDDADGAPVEGFADGFKRWAKVRPVRGREAYVNDQVLGELDLVIELRYDSKTKNIKNSDRVTYKGAVYEIESAVNVENQDKEMRLFCVEYNK